MYLHLGQDVVVPKASVIGIFDTDNTTQSYITREYLNRAEKEGKIVNISDDIPKSFVICSDEKNVTVYLSQLNSSTLLKRSETNGFENQ